MKIIETHIFPIINNGSLLCKVHIVEESCVGCAENGGMSAFIRRKYIRESANGGLGEISEINYMTLKNNKFASDSEECSLP